MELLAEPVHEQTEPVAGGSKDGFDSIVSTSVDLVALLVVVGLEMADHSLGCRRASRR